MNRHDDYPWLLNWEGDAAVRVNGNLDDFGFWWTGNTHLDEPGHWYPLPRGALCSMTVPLGVPPGDNRWWQERFPEAWKNLNLLFPTYEEQFGGYYMYPNTFERITRKLRGDPDGPWLRGRE